MNPLHPLHKPRIIESSDLLLPLLLLEPIELIDISDHRPYYPLCFDVLPQQPPRAYLLATGRALFLNLSVVVLYAVAAELMQTLPHIQRVLIYIVTNRAKQGGFLDFLEKRQVYVLVFIIFWGDLFI
jgi:hypothetical protein